MKLNFWIKIISAAEEVKPLGAISNVRTSSEYIVFRPTAFFSLAFSNSFIMFGVTSKPRLREPLELRLVVLINRRVYQ